MLQGFFTPGEPDTTGDYEDRVRKRRLAEALMTQGMDYSPVKSWTQGAARIAQALVGGYESGKYDREQKAADAPGRAILEAERQRLMGGSPSPAMPSAPGSMASAGGEPNPRLIASESGGNWQARNDAVGAGGKVGHFGRLQFGQARLQDAINAGAIPPGTTPEQFMANPELQRAAERWHFADIDKAIASGPASRAIGSVINGVPVTPQGLQAVAHLGGVGGMNRFIETGGRYNPADANGTTLMDYLKRHAGGSSAPVQTASLDGLPPGPVASDAPPMAYAPGQQAIANAMPQNPPMPPPRPGAALVGAVGGQQPQPVTSPPIPQPDGSQRLLAAALSSSSSPQLRAQLMQLYQMTQREQPKWEKLNDGTLYNPRNAETRTVGGGYRALIDPAERARYGIKPDDQNPYYVDPAGKPSALGRPSTNVTVNNENRTETAADTEAAKALVRRNVAAMDAADKAQAAMADINTMREISRRVGSVGSTADLKAAIGPYAEAFGVNLDGLSDIQAFEAVIQRMAPQMRAEGSGSTSDIEFKGMLASLPRLRFNPQAREMILDTMEANARYNIMRGDIALKVLTKEIKREDGEKQMRALGDPMQAFREFRKANPSLFTGPPPKDEPRQMTPQERALDELRRRGRT